MNDSLPVYANTLGAFQQFFQNITEDKIINTNSMWLPAFPADILISLLGETEKVLCSQGTLLEITGNCIVVGDIHGNIIDLGRILRFCQANPYNRVLFLGDYVDRGEFSLEVVVLLFSLVCMYPDQYYMIRGNHEFPNVNNTYGFRDQIISSFKSESIWCAFNKVFEWLPLGCVINGHYLCVHGGLSPTFKKLSQLKEFERPIEKFDQSFIHGVLWADPTNQVTDYLESQREQSQRNN